MNSDSASVHGTLNRVLVEIEYLAGFVRSQRELDAPDVAAVVEAYLATRRILSEELRELGTEALIGKPTALAETVRDVEETMSERYSGRVPERLLRVRGYRGIHTVLLEYLVRHANVAVSGAMLRLLAGDQVHTERRLRELRDLGYELRADKTSGEDTYTLNPAPDLEYASRFQMRKNIDQDRRLTDPEKAGLISELSL